MELGYSRGSTSHLITADTVLKEAIANLRTDEQEASQAAVADKRAK